MGLVLIMIVLGVRYFLFYYFLFVSFKEEVY